MHLLARILFMTALVGAASVRAWGPHWHITRAAIDSLGTNHALATQLGAELLPLTNYCWLPDYKRLPFRTPEQDFYPEDYLLFPAFAKHVDHLCPEVEQTYAPYFRRALQALRTESPANAARWIGSLLHFVQDSGSPPHAAQIRGDVHSKMENWVDAAKISIPGYAPRWLGTNETDAITGLIQRMNGLIAFSKVRGEKLRSSVLESNRLAVEPVALESALECARVSADVLHTIATLTEKSPARGYELSGVVNSQRAASSARFPARLVVHGTDISTLADASGRFILRGLNSGAHRITVLQPGGANFETNILWSGDITNARFVLAPSGNLVRNGDFILAWVTTNAPDCWLKVPAGWEGEILALKAGLSYRARAEFVPGREAEVLLRLSSEDPFAVSTQNPRVETHALTPDSPQFSFLAGTNAARLQLTIKTAGHPASVLKSVSVIPAFD